MNGFIGSAGTFAPETDQPEVVALRDQLASEHCRVNELQSELLTLLRSVALSEDSATSELTSLRDPCCSEPWTLPSCPQVRRSCGMVLVAEEYQGVASTRKVASFMCGHLSP